MKTVAVLTDFSDRAEHAARYAIHLAHKIKADVLLFNAFKVPAETSLSGQYAWPSETHEDIKAASENNLVALSRKLEYELKDKSFPGSYLPAINIQSEEGDIVETMAKLADNKNIILMVLSSHANGSVTDFLMGDHCRQIIDKASLPLLIVPEYAAIRNVGKFVFATDITYNDVDYINSLAGLAKKFSAEIIISDVNGNHPADVENKIATRLFMDDVSERIDYSRISYHEAPHCSCTKNMEWFIENLKFDLLVTVHRKSHSSGLFFKSASNKRVADQIHKPLLVYPYPSVATPSF